MSTYRIAARRQRCAAATAITSATVGSSVGRGNSASLLLLGLCRFRIRFWDSSYSQSQGTALCLHTERHLHSSVCVCVPRCMHMFTAAHSLSRVLIAPLIAVASAGIYEHYRVGKIVALK